MENNIIKENQLEVLPNNEIANIVVENKLPVISSSKGDLLPTIIKKDTLALMEIKREFYEVKKQRSVYGIVWFLKKILILFAKLVRYIVLASTRLVSFALLSAIIILSTTIITRNVVNSFYGFRETTEHGSEYSIYYVKDDVAARANAEKMEILNSAEVVESR